METKWILKLIDQISAPLNVIAESADGAADAANAIAGTFDEVHQNMAQMAAPTRAVTAAIDNLSESVVDASSDVNRLNKDVNAIKEDLNGYQAKLNIETDPEKIRDYTRKVEELQQNLNELEHSPDPAESRSNWGNFATAANQAYEIVSKIAESMDFAGEFNDLQNNIQRLTGFTGQELSSITKQVTNLAEVFDEDGDDIARAANVLTKQIGGSFEENLALIQSGFEKGANLNKDMIDQLKEYPTQMKQLGLSASETMALMAKAGKDGVFSDKALDSIKEAGTSLREMGQPQIDALHAIGLKVKDVAGKTTWEATQMIAKAMQTASVQAKQMALSDIFKGAGEDAGLGWIEGLGSVNLDINNIPSVKQAGDSTKGLLADMKGWFADSFGGIAQTVSILGGVGATIAGFTPIFQAIRASTIGVTLATNLAAAAQWAWNAAFIASPVGWIVLAVGAVTAAVVLAWKKFEGFRQVVFGLWEVFKQVFNNIAGLFKAVFSPIGEAISAIREGRYADAAKAAMELNPVTMMYKAGKYIAEGGLTKGTADAFNKGKKMGSDSWKADQEKPDKKPGTVYNEAFGKNKPQALTLDGKLFNNKTGTMGGSGMQVSGAGGSEGSKAITMNLTINQAFNNIGSKMDIRKIADDVAGMINDRLRDAVVSY